MGAVDDYAALADAGEAQRGRLHGATSEEDLWGGETARRFRADPRRALDSNYEIMASYVEANDVVLDVGGGAGRLSLPLAFRCRQVIVIDPSPGMGEEFKASAQEAGITNVQFIQSDWLGVGRSIQGDIILAANVTYFVCDIKTFVEKLDAAARRRVIIHIWSVPNPYHNAKLFQMVYGEEQVRVPGHRQLLPALWELGILPDIRIMASAEVVRGSPLATELPQTREDAVQVGLGGAWLAPRDRERATAVINQHFDELFAKGEAGYTPLWVPDARQMLITWETGGRIDQ